jgi:ubiquitin C-terminal hydrolase
MILHLKRFAWIPRHRKLSGEVTLERVLQLHDRVSARDVKFHHFAISEHLGSLGDGHHAAKAEVKRGEWHDFNDSTVLSSTEKAAHPVLRTDGW